MRHIIKAAAVAVAAVVMTATAAGAAVTFDPETGTGFVGKGDVQTALGWNNKQLQDKVGTVTFKYEAVTAEETIWTCSKDNGNTQERARTTTTTTSGVASSVARERNQITGFNLTGYTGDRSSSSTTDGPALESCPTGWTASSLDVGDPETISGGLYVNGVLLPDSA